MSATDRNQIQTIFEEIYPNQVRAKDPQAYAALFTETAVQMPPDVPDRYGRDAIAAGFAQQIVDKDLDPTLTVEEIQLMGDYGYVSGIAMIVVRPHDGTPSMRLKFRGVWLMKKEEEQWGIDRQIWNGKP